MPKYSLDKEIKNQTIVDVSSVADKIKYINIQSLIESHLIYSGRVSGKQYEWIKAGSIVAVLEEDATDLLSKHYGKGCCGNSEVYLFQKVI